MARTRGARPASDGGGFVICLTGSIVLIPRPVGDYERVCKSEVTPVGQVASLGNRKREPFKIHPLRMSARSLVELKIIS